MIAKRPAHIGHRTPPTVKIIHVITGLSTGGAEMMLYKLLSGMNRHRFAPEVISLTDVGPIGKWIGALEVPVSSLNMNRGVPNPSALLKLALLLRKKRPAILQTWMYHADLLGGIAAKLAGGIPVVWGIRQSNFDARTSRRTTMLTAKICARLSHRLPNSIICCSESAARVHGALGYAKEKMRIIPNGFDLARFSVRPDEHHALRAGLGFKSDAPLVGMVARFDPMKDHENFTRAAAVIHEAKPEVRFVMYGDGISQANDTLTGWLRSSGLEGICLPMGRRDDMENVYPALDLLVLSSTSEGFPNVLGEAMACGVPCVTTDVGDSALIVGETGAVVPPRDSKSLAAAVLRLLSLSISDRRALGEAARSRVATHFSLPTVVARYEALYDEILDKRKESRCVASRVS